MKPFEPSEIIPSESFSVHTSCLKIEENTNPKILLLRSLIGSIKIKHVLSRTEFVQQIDYFDLEKKNIDTPAIKRLQNYLSEDLSEEQLGDIFQNKKFLYQNLKFFTKISDEFLNYYYYTYKKSHTTAFIYLYRVLEAISYAFPLIYATHSTDFNGTYSFLKKCLSEKKDGAGELGFFKSFIKTVFGKSDYGDTVVTLNILADSPEAQELFYKAIIKVCPQNCLSSRDCNEYSSIAIKFTEYSSLIISLRNRFFHLNNSGQPNLQSNEIIDSDAFFALINGQTVYWLSVVLVEVLKHNLDAIE